jgi:hypothetical protein
VADEPHYLPRVDWIPRAGNRPPARPPNIGRRRAPECAGVPAGSSMEGLLLPRPPGKDYRLLKVVTQAATPKQIARLGNDRVPILHPPPAPPLQGDVESADAPTSSMRPPKSVTRIPPNSSRNAP